MKNLKFLSEMLAQAKALVNKMKQTTAINFYEGWKLVTMFVGGNDLCKACRDVNLNIINIFLLMFYYLSLNTLLIII